MDAIATVFESRKTITRPDGEEIVIGDGKILFQKRYKLEDASKGAGLLNRATKRRNLKRLKEIEKMMEQNYDKETNWFVVQFDISEERKQK